MWWAEAMPARRRIVHTTASASLSASSSVRAWVAAWVAAAAGVGIAVAVGGLLFSSEPVMVSFRQTAARVLTAASMSLVQVAAAVVGGFALLGIPVWVFAGYGWWIRRRDKKAGRLSRSAMLKVVRLRLLEDPETYDSEFVRSLMRWTQERVKYTEPSTVELGSAYGRVLVRWCESDGADMRLLRNAFVTGASPQEMQAHLDGTTLLDADALEMLVALRGE